MTDGDSDVAELTKTMTVQIEIDEDQVRKIADDVSAEYAQAFDAKIRSIVFDAMRERSVRLHGAPPTDVQNVVRFPKKGEYESWLDEPVSDGGHSVRDLIENDTLDEQRRASFKAGRHAAHEALRGQLERLRIDVCEHATDTAWCGPGETVVDRLSAILGDGDWYSETYLPSISNEGNDAE